MIEQLDPELNKLRDSWLPHIYTSRIPIEIFDKINEIAEAINKLGVIVDEYTGSAPEFRPLSNEAADIINSKG